MKKGSHASPEQRKRMKEAQLRARAARLSYVTAEQLKACRLDPAWEARQRVANCVVCRECGAKLQSPLGGHTGHLWRLHQMTVRAYRAAYPHARARPALDKMCPKCGFTITPDLVKRLDFDLIECPQCGEKFSSKP